MARDISATNLNAALEDAVSICFFVAINWPTGYVRVHTGIGTITYGGNDYDGLGDLGTIDAIEETAELDPRELVLTLSGINEEIVDEVITQPYWNRDVDISMGFFDAEGRLIDDPDIIWSGKVDHAALSSGTEDAVSLTCQSRAAMLGKANGARYTSEDLQRTYSGDLFLEFLSQMQSVTLVWGGERIRATEVNTGITLQQSRGRTQPNSRSPRNDRSP